VCRWAGGCFWSWAALRPSVNTGRVVSSALGPLEFLHGWWVQEEPCTALQNTLLSSTLPALGDNEVVAGPPGCPCHWTDGRQGPLSVGTQQGSWVRYQPGQYGSVGSRS
jgi:hypothetical protein